MIEDFTLLIGVGGPLISFGAGAWRRAWPVPAVAGVVMAMFLVVYLGLFVTLLFIGALTGSIS